MKRLNADTIKKEGHILALLPGIVEDKAAFGGTSYKQRTAKRHIV
jgi:hypothetical protein